MTRVVIDDGMTDAPRDSMPKRGDVPSTYDEITHDTVPELDMFGPTPPPPPSNRELASRVRAALHADARLTETQIDVGANGSHVWLSGTAIGTGTVAYAADVARAVEGVTEVYNELVVDPDA